jgi:choline dehydrogenase-like flavoprotein
VSGFVFAEQLVGAGNSITLGRDQRFRIRWQIDPEDARSLSRFLKAFVESYDDVLEDVAFFPQLLGSGAHHSGGCRMSVDKSTGVVDGGLRVFGVGNLFVADGSVLGYSGHANTGLTIAALALKCVDEVHSS